MLNEKDLSDVLDILVVCQNKFTLEDYVFIWGEELGNHIWRQEGSNLIKIWQSGLTLGQKIALVIYIKKLEDELRIEASNETYNL